MAQKKAPNAPKQPFPNSAYREYYRELNKLLEEERKAMWKLFSENLRPLIHEYRGDNDIRYDDAMDDIRRMLNNLKRRSEESIFNEDRLRNIVSNFINKVNKVNKNSISKQLKSVTGVDPLLRDKWLDSFVKSAIEENVSYIKSIEKTYFDKVQTTVYQGVRRGKGLNEMASDIKKYANVSKSRAKFIARDQAGSLYGDMTKKRHQEAGIEKFVWITSLDERVRGNPAGMYPDAIPNHWELHNQVFTWAKGVEKYGGMLPGTDFNCYDVETEVLTEEGFKLFKNLNLEDKILTLNPDTRNMEYLKPKNYIRQFVNEDLIKYTNTNIEFMVTKDHELPVLKSWDADKYGVYNAPIKMISAESLALNKHKARLIRYGNWEGQEVEYFNIGSKIYPADEFIEFLGWYLSEGSVVDVSKYEKKRLFKYQISISQIKEHYRKEIIELCKNLFDRVWVSKEAILIVGEDDLGEYLRSHGLRANEKRVPKSIKQLSSRQINIFLTAYCKGDGNFYKPRRIGDSKYFSKGFRTIFTSSGTMKDDLSELILKIGNYPTIELLNYKGKKFNIRGKEWGTKNDIWRVKENFTVSHRIKHSKFELIPYQGYVYCVEMPKNHIICIKRNNKISWNGNCRCTSKPYIAPEEDEE